MTRPERDPARSEACRDAASAAAALELQEYAFFRLAYRRWFGRQPEEEELERVFARYMLQDIVPPWVSHLTRAVLDAAAAGTLDGAAFGADRYRDRPAAPRHGRLWVAGVVVAWVVLFGALLNMVAPSSGADGGLCTNLPPGHPMALWLRLVGGADACRHVTSEPAPDTKTPPGHPPAP